MQAYSDPTLSTRRKEVGMEKFTVVGYYRDNSQPWIVHVKAPNGTQALYAALSRFDHDVVAVESLKGHLIGEGGLDWTISNKT